MDLNISEKVAKKANISEKVADVMMASAILAMLIIYVYFKKSITNESIFDILFDKGNLFEFFVVIFSVLILISGMFWLLQKLKKNFYGESIPIRPEYEQGDKSIDYRGLVFLTVLWIIAVLVFFGIMYIMSIYQYFEYILFGGFFIFILALILDKRKKEKEKRVIEGL